MIEAAREPGSPEPRALDVAETAWVGRENLAPARFPPAAIAVLAKATSRLDRTRAD